MAGVDALSHGFDATGVEWPSAQSCVLLGGLLSCPASLCASLCPQGPGAAASARRPRVRGPSLGLPPLALLFLPRSLRRGSSPLGLRSAWWGLPWTLATRPPSSWPSPRARVRSAWPRSGRASFRRRSGVPSVGPALCCTRVPSDSCGSCQFAVARSSARPSDVAGAPRLSSASSHGRLLFRAASSTGPTSCGVRWASPLFDPFARVVCGRATPGGRRGRWSPPRGARLSRRCERSSRRRPAGRSSDGGRRLVRWAGLRGRAARTGALSFVALCEK